MKDPYYGALEEKTDKRDWLGSEVDLPRAPKGTLSFEKNGKIQYDQRIVSPVSCTIVGSAGAYSALTGYKFSYDELKEMWDEAIKRGANPNVGWWGHEGVHLVYEYVRDNNLPKVNYVRVAIGSFEHLRAMRLGYNVATGYRGSTNYKNDRNDNDIIDDVLSPTDVTYGHWLHTGYSVGDEYDLIVDSYEPRENNIYKFFTGNWKAAKENRLFFNWGYHFILS